MVLSFYIVWIFLTKEKPEDGFEKIYSKRLLFFVMLNIGLIVAGIYCVARFFADRSWRVKDFYTRYIRLSSVDFVFIFTLFIGLSALFEIVAKMVVSEQRLQLAMVAMSPLMYGILLTFIFSLIKFRGGSPLLELGLNSRRYLRLIWIGFVAFLFHRPIMPIFNAISMLICHAFGVELVNNPVQDLYHGESLPILKALLLILPVVSAPFFEELLFRGVLYKVLRKHLNVVSTILITAVFFSIVHKGLYQMINIFALGVILAYLVEKTGSIIPSITLHFLVNLTSVIALALGAK